MSGELRVTSEEREALVRGEHEEFPKYTTPLLNLANQNAQSSRAEQVGKMKTILNEFQNEHPEGTYEDWVNFYMEHYDGEEKLDDSTDLLYQMVEQMREAIEQIDREMAFRFLRQLVLYKTYMGNESDVQNIILQKLEQVYSRPVERTYESSIAGSLGEIPFDIQSLDSNVKAKSSSNVAVVYYRVEHDNSIEIDTHEIDQMLGTTISDDEHPYRHLDNFSLL